MITMKDIAMQVGVSQQAVSAALNPSRHSRVSDKTREKILRIAREMNYVSNIAARSLNGAKTHTIGIMGPVADSGVHMALTSEITEMLLAEGYHILYNEYDLKTLDATDSLLQLMARGIDGIIFNCYYNLEVVQRIKQTVPYVFIGGGSNSYQPADIKVDGEYAGYMAVRHMLDHGHKKVGIMMMQSQQREHARYLGWLRAHEEAGIAVSDDDIIILRDLDGRVDKALDELKRKKITAVLAFNDYIGTRLKTVLMQNGIRVPDDIAIIGSDGMSLTQIGPVTLSTVLHPIRPQAELGVKLLFERINKKELHSEFAGHLIKPVLYPGESCGCKVKPLDKMYRLNPFSMIEKDMRMSFGIDILPTATTNQ